MIKYLHNQERKQTMDKFYIETTSSLDDIEYDIVVKVDNKEPITLVKCWDYNLAEALLKTVEEYSKGK